jgi:AcrR family transcriptional regulator
MGNEGSDSGSGASPAALKGVEHALGPGYTGYPDEVARLLHAGLQEIAERGDVEPRVVDIVKRAGLSNKAFYRHFRSKDELLLAILEEGMRARVSEFDARLARGRSATERVRIWVECVLEQAVNEQLAALTRPLLVYQARLADSLGEQLWGHADHLRAPLESALRDGLESGELAVLDPRAEAEVIYYLAMGWMHGRVMQRKRATWDEARRVADFALAGLTRPSA